MKNISDRIIVTASTVIFLLLGSYLSILAYGEVIAGSSTLQLASTWIMLIGVAGISLFSFIFMIISYRSHLHNHPH